MASNIKKWWLLEENKDIPKKLNLGSGNRPLPMMKGYINLDIDEYCNPDIVRDIRYGLPFNDDFFTEIFASHVLEHLDKDEFYVIMREMWRVTKHKGKLHIVVPLLAYNNLARVFDIDHKCVFTPITFHLFAKLNDDLTVQNNKRFHQDCYWKVLTVFEDFKGEKHKEPQLYITLECDKSE